MLLLPLAVFAQVLQESTVVDASLNDFANLHPLIVHLPIMLLPVALATQVASLFLWKQPLGWVTLIALAGGVAGAVAAGLIFHPHTLDLTSAAQEVLDRHDSYAYWTVGLSTTALILKTGDLWLFQKKRWLELLTTLVLAGSAFTVSMAGHYGATLVYLHGVGVQGNYVTGESDHEH
ncbi:hypothetical protein CGL56_08285 [Neolewinella marina]|uniref:DUF2231 domain-containing protein n=1 Tax=Neolewinella marina TaxID=438751 RepID=A0A2G0CHP4_9BACT|nr:hypothetical protein CGL56_08285 [Neolewinella marina]